MKELELLEGYVGHERMTPKKNRFRYGLFYALCPVTHNLPDTPRFFSFNRWNLLSMYTRDHGARDHTNWRTWIESQCAQLGVPLSQEDPVYLIAHPRVLGYAFNPISYWLICNADNNLKAVLCEVHNTFGDTHNYLLSRPDGAPFNANDVFEAQKKLYVSPFNLVERGSYTFTFEWSQKGFRSIINFYDAHTHILNTAMWGQRRPMTDFGILSVLFRYPLMTLHVVVRIHYQALRLYLKGVPHTLEHRRGPTSNQASRGSLKSD